MGSTASINKCTKDICCPKEVKLLEPDEREGPLLHNENIILSNGSINNDNNYNKNKQIFIFEHDDYNNDAKIESHEYENSNLDQNNFFKNELEIINEDNNIFESSNKSGFNSSNFSFKCFKNAGQLDNIKNKSKTNKFPVKYYNKKNIMMDNSSNSKYNYNKNYYLTQIKKIQRMYRKYINKKKLSEKRTNFEDENDKDKNEKNKSKSFLDKIKEKSKLNNDITLSSINIKNYSSLLLNRYLKDIDFIDVSEESFRSVTMKSNKLQELNPPQFNTRRDLDNDHIKGFFLLKKKMFKYQGKKDVDGKKIGFGKIVWEDSSKLKGYFSDSKVSGIVFFYNDGNEKSHYYGEYIDNIPDGYGIYSRKGYSIEGMYWNKNYLTGVGISVWEEGEMYEGEFKNSAKEGIGVYRWADGTSYMGHFQKNKITGIGKMNFANGNSYEGEFDEGFLSGWGKFVWDDGKFYIGNYLRDKKHGFGIFVWSLEPLIALIGFWNQGKQSGICVKLYKGHCKIIYAQESKNNIEIHSRFDTCKYLLPHQANFKSFFKKKYHEYEKFINFASKM